MSGGGGALSRLGARLSWALFRQQRCGVDELGNIYYKKLEKNAEGLEVERRFVKYAADPDPTQLPAEWHQWLHKSRKEPPTEEDIQRGIHQRELYRQRIAEIEAEDAKRRFQAASGGGRSGGGAFTQQLPGQDSKPPAE